MSQMIRISGQHLDIESDELQRAIEAVPDIRASRPICLCRPDAIDPLEMYVARVSGRFVVKRMPNTAHLHDPTCASYEAPRAISGAAEVEGRAILHDPDSDIVTLKLAFALSKNSASHAAAQAPTPPDAAKASIARLTLRSTMDYLWDAAQLNRWSPSMRGRRNYSVVHKYVRRAIDQTHAKRMSLSEALYMPEPFYSEHAAAIKERADGALVRCAFQRTGKQPLMLAFGEVKSFTDVRQGAIVQLRHAPFSSFYVSHALNAKLLRIFDAELALWNARPELHLMLIGTFSQNAAAMFEFSELALMVVDEGWIPVKNLNDVSMFTRLASEERAFIKGLRFNAQEQERFADVLLTDTDKPTAVYLMQGTEPPEEAEELAYDCEETGLAACFVRVSEIGSVKLPDAKHHHQ